MRKSCSDGGLTNSFLHLHPERIPPNFREWDSRTPGGAARPDMYPSDTELPRPFPSRDHYKRQQHTLQVFLLAPNLGSWRRMQLESPPSASLPAAGNNSRFPPEDGQCPTTPDLTPPPIGAGTVNSPDQRGFPPETPRAVTDDRGFPVLEEDIFGLQQEGSCSIARSPSHRQRRRGRGGGGGPAADWRGSLDSGHHGNNENDVSASSPSSPVPGEAPQQHRNLFLSPFSSTLPPETATLPATSRFDANRTSWVGRAASIGTGGARGGADGGRGGPQRQRPAKGSHAKLDLLLHEMHRLNGRLDTIVGRLGVLEGENRTDRGDSESAKQIRVDDIFISRRINGRGE